MKKNLLLLIVVLAATQIVTAQAKYAGIYKKFIGKTYTDSKKIKGLTGWTFIEGSVLNPITDPEMITVVVLKKGTSRLVIFSINDDTANNVFTIQDVLEVKSVLKGWTIKTAVCRDNTIENVWLIALAKEGNTEYLKTIKKVWRINPDKRRIEAIGIQRIDCLNQGD